MLTGSLLRSYKTWLIGCTLLLESEAGTIPGWPIFARLAHLPAVNHKLAAGEIYYTLSAEAARCLLPLKCPNTELRSRGLIILSA